MRWKAISILVFLCLLLDRSVTQAQADPVNELIQRVNALRRAYEVPEYQVDYALMYAAQAEAEWGLENMHFGHEVAVRRMTAPKQQVTAMVKIHFPLRM
jgi:hypothetical protein